jgi:hypothetical protein
MNVLDPDHLRCDPTTVPRSRPFVVMCCGRWDRTWVPEEPEAMAQFRREPSRSDAFGAYHFKVPIPSPCGAGLLAGFATRSSAGTTSPTLHGFAAVVPAPAERVVKAMRCIGWGEDARASTLPAWRTPQEAAPKSAGLILAGCQWQRGAYFARGSWRRPARLGAEGPGSARFSEASGMTLMHPHGLNASREVSDGQSGT